MVGDEGKRSSEAAAAFMGQSVETHVRINHTLRLELLLLMNDTLFAFSLALRGKPLRLGCVTFWAQMCESLCFERVQQACRMGRITSRPAERMHG